MAKVGNNIILNLSPSAAYCRGFLLLPEYQSHQEFIRQNPNRSNTTFVYLNGVYLGVATKQTPLFKIIEKFKIQ